MVADVVNLLTLIKQLDREKNGENYLERLERLTRRGLASLLRCTHRTKETILRCVWQTAYFEQTV